MKRHVPVKGWKGMYYSTRVDGTKVFEIRWRDLDGKQHFKVAGTDLKEALLEQAQINVKLGRGDKAHYDKMSFGAVALEWSEFKFHRVSPGTVRRYESVRDNFLIKEFGLLPIKSITTDQIAKFLHGLKSASGQPISGSYAQGIYIVLHSIMEYAANDRRGYIPKNPCRSLETSERPKPGKPERRALTEAEAQALLKHSPDWFRPILLTGLYTGMRPGEIMGLRWQDIDFNENRILVRFQLTKTGTYAATKGRTNREIPLVPNLKTLLHALPTRLSTRFSGDWIFAQADGSKATYDGLQKAFTATRDKAGIEGLTFYVCRHTYASSLLRDGKDVVRVSKYLGHKSPQVTLETYAHVIERDDWNEEAASRLHQALGDLG